MMSEGAATPVAVRPVMVDGEVDAARNADAIALSGLGIPNNFAPQVDKRLSVKRPPY
jgi:hypothetical protein